MKKQSTSVTRRKFIKNATTAALAAPVILESCANLPNDNLRHACIGVGGMGGHDLQQFVNHNNVEIIALCDVDSERLQKASELMPGARLYEDWRELLTKESGNIDSINIAVPDHNHFAIAHRAIELGKHVYCQKPMCHDVAEVRKLTELAEKMGVKTQLGTQHAASANDRTAIQLIKEGAIGKIKQVYLCSNRPGIEKYRMAGPRPAEQYTPPSSLNWDLWIGTAPMRSYAPEIYHPMVWRTWIDFGTGWSGDIGCHIFDAVWKGLNLSAPESIVADVQQSWKESPARRKDTWSQSNQITWVFPGNELTESNQLSVDWYDGEFYPPKNIRELYFGDEYPPESAMLVGTEGALLVQHGGSLVLLPQSKFKNYKIPKFKEGNHYHDFIDACLSDENARSHFAQSGPMTEAILLGTVAVRTPGTILKWDADNLKFSNSPEADELLQRTYREGWNVAGF